MVGALWLAAGTLVVAAATPAGASSASAKIKAEQAQARSALLVRSDFPTGWSGQGSVKTDVSSGGPANFPGGQQVVSCLGIPKSLLDVSAPEAVSPTFQTKGGEQSAQNTVSIAPSTKVAREASSLISSPKVPTCMNAFFQSPAARQSILGSAGNAVTIGTITVAAANRNLLIPHAAGVTISFPETVRGVTLNLQIVEISLTRGKTSSQLSLTSLTAGFSPSLARHLETVASGRI
jgi:hypothetical protein